MDRFEKLREMESFTEDMLNRILGFQQKAHPAWNPELPFEQRIKGLPLHYLVFSNGDRDPALHGPTVAHYYPLREEMQKIAHYAREVAEQPQVVDLHCGNGFIGSLLAHEGVKVIGLRDSGAKPNQIPEFYDKSAYGIRSGHIEQIDFPFDVIFSSWMPAGRNDTPGIVKRRPKLIIYVHTDHIDERSRQPQTGTPEAFTEVPGYQLIDHWSVTRPADMFHEIWPDLSRNLEEIRHVAVYADRELPNLARYENPQPGQIYDWEIELEMISLALEAKARLRALGHRL